MRAGSRLTPWRRRVLDAEFERLLELDETVRAERLRFLTKRHPRLTRRLTPLLEALSAKADHLEAMIREVADSAVSEYDGEAPELPAGTRLGAWRLVERVGRGGMGQVYRVERADGAFEMTAALKLIRVRRNRHLRDRLQMERRLLARLDHPNIARILDGGTTDNGQAWLVMEWISGRDLHQCSFDRAGNPRQCLERFLRLASAVQHAHQRQIVHGDIKPANVRIGDDERVRLLDFGVARLLAADDSDTDGRLQALTPTWSAPELRAGEPVSTQSDIWSLGALLWWMLTGEKPDHRRLENSRQAVEALARCPRRHDLAAVIARACAQTPDARYSSVTELIRDVERYRRRETVSARAQTRPYLFVRFVQRNPVGVGLGALAVALMALGLTGTSWQAHQAAAERDRARLEADKTEKVSDFLVGLFEQADPWQARERELTARDLVARGADQVRVLNETPQVQAEMYQVLARVHRGLAEYERAGQLAAEAVAVLEQDSRTPAREWARATALRAATLASQGRYLEAESAHRRALELVAGESDTVRARYMNDLGLTLYSLGRLEEARALFERALTIREAEQPGSAELAESHNNLALVHATADRNEQARTHYERAIELRREVLGKDHPTTSFSLTNLATLLVQTGQAEEALPAFHEALAIRRNAFGPDHPAVASVLYQLGWANANLGQHSTARDFYRQALAIRERTMGRDHPSVAVILNALGSANRAQGDTATARRHFERALAIYRQSFGESHHDIALVLGNLGATHLREGDHERAAEMLRQALEMNRRELGERHRHVANNLRTLAELFLRTERPELALDHARKALETYRSIHEDGDHPAVTDARDLLARIERANGH